MKKSFLNPSRVKQLNDAVSSQKILFHQAGGSDYYKVGDNPISGTEVYILPIDEATLKACRADKKLYRAHPVGKGVENSLNQYCLDLCRNQPVVDVGVIRVMQSDLFKALTTLALEWGLLEWYTFTSKPGVRLVCSDGEGGKMVIDYCPQKPSTRVAVMSGRI